MIRINRYHIASAFVLPSLFAGYHSAGSPCQGDSWVEHGTRSHIELIAPEGPRVDARAPRVSPTRRALEHDGTFWRWEFGARDGRSVAWSGGVKVELTSSPSPELLARHEPFARAASRLGFHPDVPLLTGQTSASSVAWTFLPRETLQRVSREGQGRVRAAHAVDARRTYVVYYGPDGTGADLYALDTREGAPIWRVSFGPEAVGSADSAQLVVRGGDVHLYTMSSDQRWSVRVDGQTGRVVGKRAVDPAIGEISRASLEGMNPAGGASEWLSQDDGPPTLSVTVDPARPWSLSLATSRFGGVVFKDDTLYVLGYEPGSPGALLTAVDAPTGDVRWVTRAYGLGGVFSGKIANEVELFVRDGHLVLHGQETRGEFVEAIDMASGETVMSKRYHR